MFIPGLKPTKTPIKWVPGALSMEEKRLEREADHSLQPTAKVIMCRTTRSVRATEQALTNTAPSFISAFAHMLFSRAYVSKIQLLINNFTFRLCTYEQFRFGGPRIGPGKVLPDSIGRMKKEPGIFRPRV